MIDCESSVAIVVASRDESIDLWEPLFALFREHWPNCPYPVYLVSNAAACRERGVSTIAVGPDRSWSDTLLTGLRQITQPYVLLWIDDHFLTAPVKDREVLGAIDTFTRLDGNYLRLHALPRPDAALNQHFGRIQEGALYRTSVVASLWKRTVLENLLRPGESAWDFETAGAARSDAYDGFFSTWRTCLEIENLLIKGKVRPAALRRIERSGKRALALNRPRMSALEAAGLAVRIAGNRALVKLPRRFAKQVRNAVLPRKAR